MQSTSSARGSRAEDAALAFLLQHGTRLLERNYRSASGEIDLIMDSCGVIVFVEVRYRKSDRMMDPVETIDAGKQQRLLRTGLQYLQKHEKDYPDHDYRFDVIAVSGSLDKPKINWIRNAFSA